MARKMGQCAVTSDHYYTLRVVPAAEDVVIRSAYRSLMRLYHPDTNADPEAQARVREISAAFAVLGDPVKRAAYDALPSLRNLSWIVEQAGNAPDQRSQPPMRTVGIASIAVALAIFLVVAVWPQHDLATRPQEKRTAASLPRPAQAEIVVDQLPEWRSVGRDRGALAPMASQEIEPLLLEAPGHAAIRADLPNKHQPAPERDMARGLGSQPRVSTVASDPATTSAAGSAARSNCGRSSSAADSHECRDQIATLKQMAESFFGQSMANADWSKQQLLISARNRSATSRNWCPSDDCVRDAYARQIGEIGAIMEGRPPVQ